MYCDYTGHERPLTDLMGQAEPGDQITVILRDTGIIVSELVATSDLSYELAVDVLQTSDRILHDLYTHAIKQAKQHAPFWQRRRFTYGAAYLEVRPVMLSDPVNNHRAFNHFPRVDDKPLIEALFPGFSGSPIRLPSRVAKVQF